MQQKTKKQTQNSEKQSAVIVVDMQNRFRDYTHKGQVVDNVKKLVSWARAQRYPVAWTQHHDPDPTSVLSRFWKNDILKDSKDWELMQELKPFVNIQDLRVTDKTTYDSFMKTNLESWLREHKVDTVVVCGAMSNLCCETTARSAFTRGFAVVFPQDANGTLSHEMQERTVQNIKFGFGKTPSTQELVLSIRPG